VFEIYIWVVVASGRWGATMRGDAVVIVSLTPPGGVWEGERERERE
jgi:hypothetical protein